MKHTIRVSAVAALLAASALALPTAAHADLYAPEGSCTVSPATITPGASVEFSCTDGTFGASEPVTITVEGATSAEIAFARFAVSSDATKTSTADGALPPVTISFPSNASGVYNIAAVSPTSAGGTASVSVATTAGGGAAPGSGSSLPATGLDSSALLGLWVGGGALLLAGGAVAVTAAVRRNRREHAGA